MGGGVMGAGGRVTTGTGGVTDGTGGAVTLGSDGTATEGVDTVTEGTDGGVTAGTDGTATTDGTVTDVTEGVVTVTGGRVAGGTESVVTVTAGTDGVGVVTAGALTAGNWPGLTGPGVVALVPGGGVVNPCRVVVADVGVPLGAVGIAAMRGVSSGCAARSTMTSSAAASC